MYFMKFKLALNYCGIINYHELKVEVFIDLKKVK